MSTEEIQLNTKFEIEVPYRLYKGRAIDKIPLLIADGRDSISTAGVGERRVKVYAPEEIEIGRNWKNNPILTGDAVGYDGKGNAKLVLDSVDLRAITPESERNLIYDAFLPLSDKAWNNLRGKKVMSLSKKDLQELHGEGYTRETAKQSEVWRFYLRSKRLHERYVNKVADLTQSDELDEIMHLYFDLNEYDSPVLQTWVIGDINTGFSYAESDTFNRLDEFLVGVRL